MSMPSSKLNLYSFSLFLSNHYWLGHRHSHIDEKNREILLLKGVVNQVLGDVGSIVEPATVCYRVYHNFQIFVFS